MDDWKILHNKKIFLVFIVIGQVGQWLRYEDSIKEKKSIYYCDHDMVVRSDW